MRAVIYDEIGVRPQVRSVPDPVASADGVVVRVLATGLCRSDWHAWAGHDDIALPHVPGHELAGIVDSVGTGVRNWQVGDRVSVPFVCGCGRCPWCRSGQAQVCPEQQQPGFTRWGSWAEKVALPAADANLVRIPESVGFAAAAGLGCRFATAHRALVGRARVAEGEWVTVVGAGGVGLSAVMIARACGARVVAVDRHPEALAAAVDLGAEQVVLAAGPDGSAGSDGDDVADVAARVTEVTDGGSHVAVDAVGSEETCADAIHSLRRRGRHVQIGLLPPVNGHPRVPMDRVIAWELDLLGSHGMAAADYPAMLASVERGVLQPERLVSRVVDLAEAARLLPVLDQQVVTGMIMLDPTRSASATDGELLGEA